MAKGKGSGGSMDFKVTASGLNKVDKDAKKAGSSFNTLDKNARSTDRAMKGVSNMSSNTTKNFSKMSQGITSGLVPAYATLAAQLFALDAVFRFLKEAADFRVLQEGQEAFAGVTGRAMKTLARDIQEATNAQITFKEASQAAAIGLAAGLSPTQLNELGEAAKVVSIALGRDTTDSFNRLIRGVTKAEPELLDELGIILRLDEATTAYAASLGLNKNQLTTFQKSQAVANDVLRQAEQRYGAINQLLGEDSVNQLNKLMIAFDEVMNRIRGFIGPIAEFFGEFFVKNINSAVAAIGIFTASIGSGILRGAIPTIDTRGAAQQIQTNLGDLLVPGAEGSAQEQRRQRMLQGRGTEQDVKRYQQSLNAKKSSLLTFEKVSRAEATRTFNMIKLQRQQMVVESARGFKRMSAQFKMELMTMQMSAGTTFGTIKFMAVMAGRAINAALRLAGFLGVAVMLFDVIKNVVDKFRNVDKAAEEAAEKTKTFAKSVAQLNEELEKTVLIFNSGLLTDPSQIISQVGSAFQSADLRGRISKLGAFTNILGTDHEDVKKLRAEVQLTVTQLSLMDETFADLVISQTRAGKSLIDMSGELVKHSNLRVSQMQAVKSLQQAEANSLKQVNALVQALPKIPFQEAIKSIEQEVLALEQLNSVTGVGGVETEMYALKLEKATAQLKMFRTISEQQLMIQMALNDATEASEKGKFAVFGDAAKIAGAAKFAKGLESLLKASTNVLTAKNNLAIAQAQGAGVENAEAQLKLAQQLFDIEMQRLANIELQNNQAFQLYRKLFTDLETELGTAFGKVLRGETGAFKDFGKTMVKTLTDQLGKRLANLQLKLMFGGTPLDPSFQREQFISDLKAQFKAGFSDKDSPFMKGGNSAATMIKQGMLQAATAHVKGLLDFRKLDLQSRLAVEKIKEKEAKDQLDLATKNLNAVENFETSLAESKAFVNRSQTERIANEVVRPTITAAEAFFKKSRADAFEAGVPMSSAHEYTSQKFSNRFTKLLFARMKLENPDLYNMADAKGLRLMDVPDLEGFIKMQEQEFRGIYGPGAEELFNKLYSDIIASIRQDEQEVKFHKTAIDNETQGRIEAEVAQADAKSSIESLTANYEEQGRVVEAVSDALQSLGFNVDLTTGKITELGDEAGTPETVKLSRKERRQELIEQEYPTLMSGGSQVVKNTVEFGTAVGEFGGFIAMGLGLTGEQEKAAKLMQKVAMMQMAFLVAEKAAAFGKGFADGGGLIGGFQQMLGLRYGGMSKRGGRYGAATGGIFDGPESGYNVKMHGNEAVVPLGNDRAIPVEMRGSGGTNNVNVTVNVDQNGQAESVLTGDGARELGKTIAMIAQDTIAKEQRAGGLLSNI